MATPCIYYIDGKEFTKEQFLAYVKKSNTTTVKETIDSGIKAIDTKLQTLRDALKDANSKIDVATKSDEQYAKPTDKDFGKRYNAQANARQVDDVRLLADRRSNIQSEYNRLTDERARIADTYPIKATPSAPFVTDTNAWTKLGLKVALKEAIAQGATKLSWATGTQQFERWGSEEIIWEKNKDEVKIENGKIIINGKETGTIKKSKFDGDFIVEDNKTGERYVVKSEAEILNKGRGFSLVINEQTTGATAFNGQVTGNRDSLSIQTKAELRAAIDKNLKRERNDAEIDKLTDRIWKRMQTEDSGTSLPRKEGMEGFYGNPTDGSIGIVGGVAEKLFRQKVGTVEIETGKNGSSKEYSKIKNKNGNYDVFQNGVYEIGSDLSEQRANDLIKKYQLEQSKQSTQHSIDITPEMKSEVEKGLPLFQKDKTGKPKGAVETLSDGRKVIHALDAPDFSTMVHEIAHIFEGDLTESEKKVVKDFGGSEPFARGFEKYLRDGKSPTPELKTLFEKFKTWLTDIYQTLKGSPIAKKLSPEIKGIFDRLLTEKTESETAPKPTPTADKNKAEVVEPIQNKKLQKLFDKSKESRVKTETEIKKVVTSYNSNGEKVAYYVTKLGKNSHTNGIVLSFRTYNLEHGTGGYETTYWISDADINNFKSYLGSRGDVENTIKTLGLDSKIKSYKTNNTPTEKFKYKGVSDIINAHEDYYKENPNEVYASGDDVANAINGEVVENKEAPKKSDAVEEKKIEPIEDAPRNQNLSDNPTGNSGETKFTDDVVVPYTFKLIEAEDLQPSHLPSGERNPLHTIANAQPKERNDLSSKLKQDEISEKPNFNEVSDSPNAYFGSPIVNESGEVIQGNNRSIGLKKHYEKGGDKYKNDLLANAEKYGLTKEQVEGMKNPILVREVRVSDAEAIKLGQHDVKDLETGGKQSIDPIATSRKMSPSDKSKLAGLLFSGEHTTIKEAIRANMQAIGKILKGNINSAQFRQAFNDAGELTAKGMSDVQDIVKHFLFEDGKATLPEVFDGLPSVIQKGLEKSMQDILSVSKDKSLLTEIQNAMLALHEFKNQKSLPEFDAWVQAHDIFKGAKPSDVFTPLELQLAKDLDKAKKEGDIKSIFRKYADAVNDTKPTMFEPNGVKGISKEEAIKKLFKIDYDGKENKPEGHPEPKSKGEHNGVAESKKVPEKEKPSKEVDYPHPMVKKLSELYDNAEDEYSKNRTAEDLAYSLAGDANKKTRQEILTALTGEKVPAAKSGVHALEDAFNKWIDENKKQSVTVKEKTPTVTPDLAPEPKTVTPEGNKISDGAKKMAEIDEKIAASKKAISDKLRANRGELGMNKLPLNIIPDLIELSKLYIEKYGRQFAQYLKGFRSEHPEFEGVTDAEIKSELFDKANEGSKKKTVLKLESDDKSVLNRIYNSEKIPDSVKEKFEEKGLKYEPQKWDEAAKTAKVLVDELGSENAVALVEQGKFNNAIGTFIFGEAIDRAYLKGEEAKTNQEKIDAANEWADYSIRLDERARGSGQLISGIQDYYRKSPLGIVIKAEKEFSRRTDAVLEPKTKNIKDALKELVGTPEFEEYVKQRIKEEAATHKTSRKQKVDKFFDSIKSPKKDGGINSFIVPPKVWDGAVEVMRKAAHAGLSVAEVVERAVGYINANFKEGWDEKQFRNEYQEKISQLYKETKYDLTEGQKHIILEKWRQKLKGLNEAERKTLLARSVNHIVENGGLDFADFKKMYADALGLPTMTEALRGKIMELGKTINEADKISLDLQEKRTPELLKKYDEALVKRDKASREINELLGSEKHPFDTLMNLMRLNTLTPISMIANPIYNIALMPTRGMTGFIHSAIDNFVIDPLVKGFPKLKNKKFFQEPIHTPITSTPAYAKGFKTGFSKSVKQFFTGLSDKDYFQKEIKQNIQPFTQAKRLWRWANGKEKLQTKEAINALLEASPFGMTAELHARALNVGDKMFRYAAEHQMADLIAKEKDLSGIDAEIFKRLPDEESKKRIVDAGEKAILAQENFASQLQAGIGKVATDFAKDRPMVKPFFATARVVATATQPFLRIPVNAAIYSFELSMPEFSMAMGLSHAYKGNRSLALNYFGKAATGIAIRYVTMQMALLGILTPDEDDNRERRGLSQYLMPYSLNISAMRRWTLGGSPEKKSGDIQVNLNYLGALGFMMGISAKVQQDKTYAKNQGETQGLIDDVMSRLSYNLQEGFSQGTFRGISGLQQGLVNGNYDTWLGSMVNVMENTVEPSELKLLSQMGRDTKPDFGSMGTMDKLSANLKLRFFGGNDIPADVNMWGQDMKSIPEGRNKLPYYFFDVTKYSTIDKQQFGAELSNLYQKTADPKVFPNEPMPKLTVDGKAIKLKPKEYHDFKQVIGTSRKELTESLFNDSDYIDATDDEKIKMLNKVYDDGYEEGKIIFEGQYPELFPNE